MSNMEEEGYRNVSSAGQCKMLWHRHESIIEKIEPLELKTAIPYFPLFERKVLRLIGTDHYVKMKKQSVEPMGEKVDQATLSDNPSS